MTMALMVIILTTAQGLDEHFIAVNFVKQFNLTICSIRERPRNIKSFLCSQ